MSVLVGCVRVVASALRLRGNNVNQRATERERERESRQEKQIKVNQGTYKIRRA